MEKREQLLSSGSFNKGIFNLDSGKIPPQALDLEEAVLGAMLIDKKGVDEVIDILQKDAFYKTLFDDSINCWNVEGVTE